MGPLLIIGSCVVPFTSCLLNLGEEDLLPQINGGTPSHRVRLVRTGNGRNHLVFLLKVPWDRLPGFR